MEDKLNSLQEKTILMEESPRQGPLGFTNANPAKNLFSRVKLILIKDKLIQ